MPQVEPGRILVGPGQRQGLPFSEEAAHEGDAGRRPVLAEDVGPGLLDLADHQVVLAAARQLVERRRGFDAQDDPEASMGRSGSSIGRRSTGFQAPLSA